ncbi:MAG: tetratricopeptide repeat protein [Thermoanaerobaculia bacterium]|mgnify:CR=1 FL=1
MSNRLSRKEVKRDELAAAVERTMDYATSHRQMLNRILFGVALVVLAAVAITVFMRKGGSAADDALAQAIKVFEAPIEATSPKPSDPDEPSFATQDARRARAKELLEGVRSKYRGSEASQVAGLFLGRLAAEKGDLDTARSLWQEFVDASPNGMLAAETRLNLLRLDLAKGGKEETLKKLEGMLAEAKKPLPEDVLLYEIATVRTELGKTNEALSAYQRIVDEFPGSPYQRDAQLKVNALSGGRSAT